MKKAIYTILAISGFACNESSGPDSFQVEGTVKNTSAKMVYLEEISANNSNPVIMDSATLGNNGTFELKAQASEESLYQLRLNDKLTPFALLINDAPKINVQANPANAEEPFTVEGSPASKSLIEFDKTSYRHGLKIFTLASKYDSLKKANAPDSIASITYNELESAANAFKSNAQEFLNKSNSPMLTLYTLSSFQNTAAKLRMPGFSQEEVVNLVRATAAKHPQHSAIQKVKSRLPAEETKGEFKPRKAPEFSQPDINGKPVSLSSFKGKYVLLDFWASWCKPCRLENPNVVKAYQEFKEKNFTVFGVSLDENKEAWQQAIQKDGLTWTHASDLQSWNNAAAALYGVQSIPANFLIDPQGNIIAQDLRGEELMETLRKVLK
jgi:peroxiredoxin